MGLFKKPTPRITTPVVIPPTPQTVNNIVSANVTSSEQFLLITIDGDLSASFILNKLTLVNSAGNVLQLFSGDILVGVLTFTTKAQASLAFTTIQTAINNLTA